MDKYYKVLKDTFIWDKDTILKNSIYKSNGRGYVPVDNIFFKDCCEDLNEYVSDKIIENNPDWFQRVYPVNTLTKVVYGTKEKVKEVMKNIYKE